MPPDRRITPQQPQQIINSLHTRGDSAQMLVLDPAHSSALPAPCQQQATPQEASWRVRMLVSCLGRGHAINTCGPSLPRMMPCIPDLACYVDAGRVARGPEQARSLDTGFWTRSARFRVFVAGSASSLALLKVTSDQHQPSHLMSSFRTPSSKVTWSMRVTNA